ncbi:MAG: DUF169 domain-containing protein [Prevotella sp.]|jgi:uncharacterized protein (DUF169 family)|nr:DUF169 domain-containing protein [Prevotella sp.]
MEISTFITNYREAFGEAAELPIVFWYSDEKIADTQKIGGCFFKEIKTLRNGGSISLNAENIGCGGGKFYMGFAEMPEYVPNFVSLKEKYKQTPEMFVDSVKQLNVQRTNRQFLNFARIDKISSFDDIEGVIFFATPDILSGLASWASFDNNSENAVVSRIGSSCSDVVTQVVNEHKINGKKTFIGFFDTSARQYIEANILSFAVPMSRFREMYGTMRASSLFNTHAWTKIRERIND